MDSCFPSYYNSYGWQFYEVTSLPEFKRIENEIKQKTISLSKKNDKDEFRKGCLNLADYLISKNNPPRYYEDYKVTWKGSLNNKLSGYYKNLGKHGGCPLILEKEDKKILQLNYEEIDFCEKKKRDIEKINQLGNISKDSDTYRSMCNAYNEWIEQKKKYFEDKKSSFKKCDRTKGQKKKTKGSSEFICDLMNPQTFHRISDCQAPNKLSPREAVSESTQKGLKSQDQEVSKASITTTVPSDQGHLTKISENAEDKEISPDSQEIQKELQSTPPQELHSNVQISTSETTAMGSESTSTGDTPVTPLQYTIDSEAPRPESSTFYKLPDRDSQSSEIPIDAEIVQSPGVSRNDSLPSVLPASSKILGIINNTYTISEITTIYNIYI
ncbi:PIR Superfamily Protein [Plasmodium malariae]|uniref:PIR Superfamily Protein n=1 Tax=Plasmodium malariae TaxID=5858 RepID=A0A1A8WQU9_PLAMA|nr:PIR Superfamily Protein [Plasmodium malariae]